MPKFIPHRLPSGRTQSAVLVLLLLVALVISALMTQQGREAARAHEETVDRLLRDHAAVAAGRYVDVAQMGVVAALKPLFVRHWPIRSFDRVELRLPAGFEAVCYCDLDAQIEYYFVYSYQDGRFKFGKGRPAPADSARLRRLLESETPFLRLKNDVTLTIGGRTALGRPAVFVLATNTRPAGGPTVAQGFVGRPELLRELLPLIQPFNESFPAYDEPKPDRFAIAVYDRGEALLTSTVPASVYSASAAMPPGFGGFEVRASINPRDVPVLAGTAAPRFRVPLFFALLSLSALVVIAVLFLFRREAELSRARANFVAGVSHELRTPLAQIRMFTETLLLGRTRTEAERRRSLEIIDQEARRLTVLVDNVLSLRAVDGGRVRLAPAATALAPMVEEVVASFRQMPRLKTVELRTELEPRLIASVDAGAFRQILLNLIDNAVKYGPPEQRVIIGLAMFDENARLWVDDEGPGIPGRERERVFEAFYRSSVHADNRVPGSGIGLAIVRELAALLGGRAWAEQSTAGGARMVVEFPDAYLRPSEATGTIAVA